MNNTFKPCMHILPPAQQAIWPKLKCMSALGYVLYGGTAIALRLGHRESVDFDFFSHQALNREGLIEQFPLLRNCTTLQDTKNTWVVLTPGESNEQVGVKLSFFGEIEFGRVGHPNFTDDHTLLVASLHDLMATKLKVILQRAEAKDYRDIAMMLHHGQSLPYGLGAARAIFGNNFQPSESLKALTYFNDGDLHLLTHEEKESLIESARLVQDIPVVDLCAKTLD